MIKSKDFTLPSKSAFTIPTHDDFMKLHTLLCCISKRGGGKSVSIANLLRKARDRGYFDKIFLITPTYNSNKQIWDICYINPETDLIEPDEQSIKKVIEYVENDKKEWDAYEEKMKLYKQFQKDRHKNAYKIPDEIFDKYIQHDFFDMLPKWKYEDDEHYKFPVHSPRIALILDDCLSISVMSKPSTGLQNLCIRHRHIGCIGLSVFMLVQSYKCQGGVSRVIRENTTHLMLFKNKDENQIEAILEEIGTDVDKDYFLECYRDATKEDYGFLFIHFNPVFKGKFLMKNFETYY